MWTSTYDPFYFGKHGIDLSIDCFVFVNATFITTILINKSSWKISIQIDPKQNHKYLI